MSKLYHLIMICILAMAALFSMVMSTAKGETRVAVIDGPLLHEESMNMSFKMCKKGHFDFNTQKPVVARANDVHSYYVTNLISQVAQRNDVCFVMLNVMGRNVKPGAIGKAIDLALKYKVKAVNISIVSTELLESEKSAIKRALRRGVRIFVAAGNDSKNLNEVCNTYPACYRIKHKNYKVVGAIDVYWQKAYYSNYGTMVNQWEFGEVGPLRGTSFASPRALGLYLRGEKNGR